MGLLRELAKDLIDKNPPRRAEDSPEDVERLKTRARKGDSMRHKWEVVKHDRWRFTADLLKCRNCGAGPMRRTDVRRGIGPCHPRPSEEAPP